MKRKVAQLEGSAAAAAAAAAAADALDPERKVRAAEKQLHAAIEEEKLQLGKGAGANDQQEPGVAGKGEGSKGREDGMPGQEPSKVGGEASAEVKHGVQEQAGASSHSEGDGKGSGAKAHGMGAVAAAKAALAAAEALRARSGGDAGAAGEDGPPLTLDDLFRKTKTQPAIYWLPLNDEQVGGKLKHWE